MPFGKIFHCAVQTQGCSQRTEFNPYLANIHNSEANISSEGVGNPSGVSKAYIFKHIQRLGKRKNVESRRNN